jgi:hypothetical protein
MVPDVEEIGAEPHILPLSNLEVLQERHIPVLLEGAVVKVASQIAECRCAEIRIGSTIGRIDQRSRRERRGI